MEIVTYFAKEWHVIGQAPVTFFTAAILLMAVSYAAASWRFGGIIASQVAQIALLDRTLSAHPSGADYEKRKAIVDQLGLYLARGTTLMNAAREHTEPAPHDEAQVWLNELVAYLTKELGPSYVSRVNDFATAPIGYGGSYPEHDKVYNGVRIRVYHLQEFLKELARA